MTSETITALRSCRVLCGRAGAALPMGGSRIVASGGGA
jgi:hypothetical protein